MNNLKSLKDKFNIEMYFINWNDSFYIPLIAEHYGKFCSRIKMYDNSSTDDSVNLAHYYGFEIEYFGYNELNDQHYLDVKNHCWKGSKADYVIVCDADEFVYPIDLKGSLPTVTGFNMIENDLTISSVDQLKNGYEDSNYSKFAIFDPQLIKEINYVHGCHVANPIGHIDKSGTCILKHARCIHGVDKLIERHYIYKRRMSKFNARHRMGFHYLASAEAKRNEWKLMEQKASKIF